jgi:HJR/Mrr/RecB family endonuclease
MDPVTFELWAITRMSKLGYEKWSTPTTGDRGADGILRHTKTGRTIIVQCKKLAPEALCGSTAIDQLLNARQFYKLHDATLIALTTAKGFDNQTTKRASEIKIVLRSRNQLLNWGTADV